jgi:hypothetical protein
VICGNFAGTSGRNITSNCQGMSREIAPVSESSVPPTAFDVSGGTIPVPGPLFAHGLSPVGDGGRGLGSQKR